MFIIKPHSEGRPHRLITSPQGVWAVLRVQRLSTRGHRPLESLLSDHWRQLLVLQRAEDRERMRSHTLPPMCVSLLLNDLSTISWHSKEEMSSMSNCPSGRGCRHV